MNIHNRTLRLFYKHKSLDRGTTVVCSEGSCKGVPQGIPDSESEKTVLKNKGLHQITYGSSRPKTLTATKQKQDSKCRIIPV